MVRAGKDFKQESKPERHRILATGCAFLNTLAPAFLCSGQRKDKEDLSLVKGENSLKGKELS